MDQIYLSDQLGVWILVAVAENSGKGVQLSVL
ncbi:uncharacterized protein METZ01_LOCUS167319 [marine metagenome]|uniref:Uncharacterized protein n=1 Tax=marine metagenome TaxID=408172 RepID=A0A382BKZ2_9ZZZZ